MVKHINMPTYFLASVVCGVKIATIITLCTLAKTNLGCSSNATATHEMAPKIYTLEKHDTQNIKGASGTFKPQSIIVKTQQAPCIVTLHG